MNYTYLQKYQCFNCVILKTSAKIVTLQSDIQTFAEYTVAPYVGAWIETFSKDYIGENNFVAPYVGAWIGTFRMFCRPHIEKLRPMWVCV